jgi:hypothetical protein
MRIFVIAANYELRVNSKSHLRDHPTLDVLDHRNLFNFLLCVKEGEEDQVEAKASVAEKILQGRTVSAGTFQSEFDLRQRSGLFF